MIFFEEKNLLKKNIAGYIPLCTVCYHTQALPSLPLTILWWIVACYSVSIVEAHQEYILDIGLDTLPVSVCL